MPGGLEVAEEGVEEEQRLSSTQGMSLQHTPESNFSSTLPHAPSAKTALNTISSFLLNSFPPLRRCLCARGRQPRGRQGRERVPAPQLRRPRQLSKEERQGPGQVPAGHLPPGTTHDTGQPAEQGKIFVVYVFVL